MRGKNRSLGGRGGRPCFSVGVAGGGMAGGRKAEGLDANEAESVLVRAGRGSSRI